MNLITLVGLTAAASTTFSFLPQAIKTIQTKNTSGVSFSMYSLFAIGTLFWLLYGMLIINLPIIFANGITLILSIIILVYKIKYK